MEEKIKKVFIEVLKIEESKFNDTLSQGNCMNWDSMNHLAIITELEKRFKIKFSVDDVLAMSDVKTVKERINKRITR